jgi:transitional endoplasmic reticulum ATPase
MRDSVLRFRGLRASASSDVALLPSQEVFYDRLVKASRNAPVVACTGPQGMGRSTLLRRLADELNAFYLDVPTVLRLKRSYPLGKIDEVIRQIILEGLRRHRTVVFDDFADIFRIRGDVFAVFIGEIGSRAVREGWHLVLGGNGVGDNLQKIRIFGDLSTELAAQPLTEADYASFFRNRFGARVEGIDFGILHSAAPGLDLHQLVYLANRLERFEAIDLSTIEMLIDTEIRKGNVRLAEVEALSFEGLPGTESVVRALETHVVLPLEQKALAHQLGLKPRRGVLLYGPPGTGKTSIGRALAHRMQGRFFLIDGSVITEPPSSFFAQVDAIVAKAKANAPCVLFIDDADLLFQIEHVQGFSRYLLSLLDGIESETASKVCIMLTAMDPAKLPSALLRSGRVELWLEIKAPDTATRAAILQRWTAQDIGSDGIDLQRLAEATEGFTPADLRRVAADARLFRAADQIAKRPVAETQAYLDLAVAELGKLRDTMASRLSDDAGRSRLYA